MDEFQSQLHLALTHMIRLLVDKPDEMTIRLRPNGQPFEFQIVVADDDLGKVIGKQGRTARAIRTIVAGFGRKNNRPVVLDILPVTAMNPQSSI